MRSSDNQSRHQNSFSSPPTLIPFSESCTCTPHLKQIHAALIRRHLPGTTATNCILAKLLRFAAVSPSGDLRYAATLFSYHHHSIISSSRNPAFFYNTLIRGYANSPTPSLALSLFNSMRRRSVHPDPFSFTFLFKARSRFPSPALAPSPEPIHAQTLKFGCLSLHPAHLHVHNALIHLYASRASPSAARQAFEEMPAPDVVSWSGLLTAHLKARELDAARQVFDVMPERDVVSWTAMISGYAQAHRPGDALDLFRIMPVPPDEVTMVGVVSACAAMADLEAGEGVHRYIEAEGFSWMVSLRNALVDMYAKCGCLQSARQVFDGTTNKTLVSWNSMIKACAAHGDADSAIVMFHRMVAEGVRPDGVTLLAVLTACAHEGRMDEGREVFELLRRGEFGDGVEVGVEHYGCMVDMLGRAGLLEEAYRLIEGMRVPCNDVVWGALLGACRIHGDVAMAERAVEKLMRLKPEEGGYYVLLSSIYAEAGQQAKAAEMRQAMRERGASKTPGCSTCTSICP